MLKSLTKFIDLFGIDHLYQHLSARLKYKTRPLTENEIEIGKSVFSDAIDYKKVRIDEKSYTARHLQVIYVSFNTINSWGRMPKDILIHELVHIWQYQKLGSIYIAEALAAQRSEAGYDYGGVTALKNALENKKTLLNFNFEQQGDIVQDYFRLRSGFAAQHDAKATKQDLPIYWQVIAPNLELK